MEARAEMSKEPDQEGPICGARLAPLLITHSIVLAAGVVWLIAILSG